MACALPLLLAAACGGEEAITFRNRNAADWGARLTHPDTQAAAFAELRKGGVDALPVLIVMLESDDSLVPLAAGDMIGGMSMGVWRKVQRSPTPSKIPGMAQGNQETKSRTPLPMKRLLTMI